MVSEEIFKISALRTDLKPSIYTPNNVLLFPILLKGFFSQYLVGCCNMCYLRKYVFFSRMIEFYVFNSEIEAYGFLNSNTFLYASSQHVCIFYNNNLPI